MPVENITELRAELVEVKEAISIARRSISHSDGTHAVAHQTLRDLRADKQELITKIDSLEPGGGITITGVTIDD